MEDEYQSDFIESWTTSRPLTCWVTWTRRRSRRHRARPVLRARETPCALWAWKTQRRSAACSATALAHDDHAVRIRRRYRHRRGTPLRCFMSFRGLSFRPLLHTCVDEYDKLVGVRSLRTLVLTDDKTPMSKCMYDDLITATPDETEEDVSRRHLLRHDLTAMPVVDEHGTLSSPSTTPGMPSRTTSAATKRKLRLEVGRHCDRCRSS